MKPALVTGANGHLGNNLCRLLVARGEPVRAMIRPSADAAPLAGLDLETVRGDIVDPASTGRALEGCGRLYHTAAGFLMWSRDPERDIIRPSVEGTRNVLEAAARAGVEKVLYTSTSGTMGLPTRPDQPFDETHFNTEPHTHYLRGKIAAEKEAFAIAGRTGLPVTSIHPGFVLGPRFWKPSESVHQVEQFLNHGSPIYFDGGFGVVDVEDVARGAILAMDKGRAGERYLLSGENVTVKGLFDRSQVDEFAGKYGYFDSGKAERELGYTYLPARETVRRTIAWLVARGFVSERRQRALRLDPSLRNPAAA